MPPLSWANTAVILLSVATTLLLLRNNHIPLHQSSNFVQSLSNHPGSGTILFSMLACAFSLYTAGVVNISSVSSVAGSVLLFDMLSLVILSNPNISSSASIVSRFCHAILFVCGFYHDCLLLIFILIHSLTPQPFISF